MTFLQFSQNKAAREHLQKMLNDPVMKSVLEMLRDANLPKVLMQLPGAPEGMDPLHAIAISSTHRSGFQHALTLLQRLPSMDPPSDGALPSQAWEWTATAEKATKTKRRKTQ